MPNTHFEVVRKWIEENNYKIVNEKIVNHIYGKKKYNFQLFHITL
jgi:tRNA A22 N-methylase